jgi:hypothetical protein
MIFASHLVVYSQDADADRAVLRDVFGWESVDAGDGWLIFALPPAEAVIHPADQPSIALYLMSTDLDSDVRALESNGVQFAAVETARWGSVTTFTLPGGCRIGLYQPSHPSLITPPQ